MRCTLIKRGQFLTRDNTWVDELDKECQLGEIEDIILLHISIENSQIISWGWSMGEVHYFVVPLTEIVGHALGMIVLYQANKLYHVPNNYSQEDINKIQNWLYKSIKPLLEYDNNNLPV